MLCQVGEALGPGPSSCWALSRPGGRETVAGWQPSGRRGPTREAQTLGPGRGGPAGPSGGPEPGAPPANTALSTRCHLQGQRTHWNWSHDRSAHRNLCRAPSRLVSRDLAVTDVQTRPRQRHRQGRRPQLWPGAPSGRLPCQRPDERQGGAGGSGPGPSLAAGNRGPNPLAGRGPPACSRLAGTALLLSSRLRGHSLCVPFSLRCGHRHPGSGTGNVPPEPTDTRGRRGSPGAAGCGPALHRGLAGPPCPCPWRSERCVVNARDVSAPPAAPSTRIPGAGRPRDRALPAAALPPRSWRHRPLHVHVHGLTNTEPAYRGPRGQPESPRPSHPRGPPGQTESAEAAGARGFQKLPGGTVSTSEWRQVVPSQPRRRLRRPRIPQMTFPMT